MSSKQKPLSETKQQRIGAVEAESSTSADGACVLETPSDAQADKGFRSYLSILKTKEAYLFDLGTLLMRLYMPMITLGVVSMLTLAGYSALFAGSVSSTVAAALFVIAPRVSKRVDERGQSAVVPRAALIAMGGRFCMLGVVQFGLPQWLCYPCAVLMGFSPQPQALARTRWLFLIETGRLGKNPPSVRTVFSYEGVMDDVAFMFGPALCIALSAAIVPIAGMLFGSVSYLLGVVLLMCSKNTEPDDRWRAANAGDAREKGTRSAIVLFPPVRVLFVLMVLMGATFGIFDTTTVALTESLGKPTAASVCLMVAGAVSVCAGFVFGGIRFKMNAAKLLATTASLFAVGYGVMVFIEDIPALFIVSVLGSFVYAPFFISTNNMCEKCVPKQRITESLTWVSAGFSCGSAIGPTLAGLFVDTFGAPAGFDAGAVFSFAIIPVALLTYRIMKRALRQENA
ncbi:MAG: MFS transporter [Eggerthellaceae bacterium]|nr:MFS transporter [Eggerthellaceae bacterium]